MATHSVLIVRRRADRPDRGARTLPSRRRRAHRRPRAATVAGVAGPRGAGPHDGTAARARRGRRDGDAGQSRRFGDAVRGRSHPGAHRIAPDAKPVQLHPDARPIGDRTAADRATGAPGCQGRARRRGDLAARPPPPTDTVEVSLRDAEGARERVEASYVIGADGPHSTVRKKRWAFLSRPHPAAQLRARRPAHRRRGRPRTRCRSSWPPEASSRCSRWAAGRYRLMATDPTGRRLPRRHSGRRAAAATLRPRRADSRASARPELEFTLPDQQQMRAHTAVGAGVPRR